MSDCFYVDYGYCGVLGEGFDDFVLVVYLLILEFWKGVYCDQVYVVVQYVCYFGDVFFGIIVYYVIYFEFDWLCIFVGCQYDGVVIEVKCIQFEVGVGVY